MGQELRETSARRVIGRLGAIGALAALCLLVDGPSAMAATTKATPFITESQPLTWPATQPDGTPVTSAVTIDKA